MPMNPRLLVPRASGFSPRRISGLEAWYDASVASSVVLTNNFVSQWNDLGPNGLHVAQGSEANRPAVGTVNGLGSIVFDGSNDFLQRDSYTGTVGTVFCAHVSSATTGQGVYSFARPGSVAGLSSMAMLLSSAGPEYRFNGSWGDVSPVVQVHVSGGTVTTGQRRITSHTFDGTAATASLDGTSLTGTTTTTHSNQAVILFGSRLITATYSLPLNGSLCEIIAYNRVLSDSEIAKVETYLAAKWGVTLA